MMEMPARLNSPPDATSSNLMLLDTQSPEKYGRMMKTTSGNMSKAPVTYPRISEGFTPKTLKAQTATTIPIPINCARPKVASAGVV